MEIIILWILVKLNAPWYLWLAYFSTLIINLYYELSEKQTKKNEKELEQIEKENERVAIAIKQKKTPCCASECPYSNSEMKPKICRKHCSNISDRHET